jgi:hypothetical protein
MKNKTVYEKYSREEREKELAPVRTQLYTIGFDNTIEDFQTMFKIIDDYIETGSSMSGALKLVGYEREFLYLFPETKKHKIKCMIRYVTGV